MGLKTKLRQAFLPLSRKDKAVLRHIDVLAPTLDIKMSKEMIVDKVNAFDWLDLQEAKSEEAYSLIVLRFFMSFNFKYPKAFEAIILRAFAYKFTEAVRYLKEAVEYVHHAYPIEGSTKGFQNATVNKFYYIAYWADKKSIPVNYNEKKQEKRELFNLDTIFISILADRLAAFNEHERVKPKKK